MTCMADFPFISTFIAFGVFEAIKYMQLHNGLLMPAYRLDW